MAVQKQDDQHEHTFSNFVKIQDVVQKTCLRRWTIGKNGERGSGISVLPARHDDDDDDRVRLIYLGFTYWIIWKNLILLDDPKGETEVDWLYRLHSFKFALLRVSNSFYFQLSWFCRCFFVFCFLFFFFRLGIVARFNYFQIAHVSLVFCKVYHLMIFFHTIRLPNCIFIALVCSLHSHVRKI